MTVRMRLLVVLAAMSLMAIVAMTVPFVATSTLLDEMSQSTSNTSRAVAAYADLTWALGRQETSVSGYVLTHDTDYVDQFHAAVAAEQDAYDQIEEGNELGSGFRDGFDEVRNAMTQWRAAYAEPTIDDIRTRRLVAATSTARQTLGNNLSEQVRVKTQSLDERLDATDDDLAGHVNVVAAMRLAMFVMGVAAILVGLVIAVKLTRDWISRPLRSLVSTARRVEQGEDAPFVAGRRDEIGDLGAALERMRRRIVAGQLAAETAVEHSNVLNFFTELTAFTETDVEVSQALLTAIVELMHPDSAVVHVANRSRDRAVPEATIGDATAEILALRSLDNCPGVRRGSLYVTADVARPLAVRCHIQPVEQGTVACLPLTALGETIGAVHLHWEAADAMPLNLRATLSRIAEHAALSIGNRRLVRALQGMANTDARTGLPNSRAFDDAVESVLATRSADAPEAILMLDLDHFKAFNDRYGHPAGDEALRAFAGILRSSVRDEDMAARYGGEEFAIHLRGLGRDEALEVAERIRGRVEQAILSLGPGLTGRITASLGVAIAPTDGSDRISLLRAADSALYVAKASGRNRVATTSEVSVDPAAHDGPTPLDIAPAEAS